jgi:hypothetical protein
MLYQLFPRYYFYEQSHHYRIDRITGQIDKFDTESQNWKPFGDPKRKIFWE